MTKLQGKAKGERPYFFRDPNGGKPGGMVMGLAGEVAAQRTATSIQPAGE